MSTHDLVPHLRASLAAAICYLLKHKETELPYTVIRGAGLVWWLRIEIQESECVGSVLDFAFQEQCDPGHIA